MDDVNDLIGYLLIKGAISGRYKYVLSDAHTKEVLAVDDQPYLLNFLRLGLSDCTMTVLPDNIALDYESTITHLKLMVLKRLMLEIEKAKCDLMLTAPEHLSFTLTDELRKFSKEYYDIDADLLQKEIKFAKNNIDLFISKSVIVFSFWGNKILSANNKEDLETIRVQLTMGIQRYYAAPK
jgi:hypothetical protein